MTPEMRTYLVHHEVRFAEVHSDQLKEGDQLILFSYGAEIHAHTVVIVNTTEFIDGQMMKVTTCARNFELRRGVSYGIIAKVLNLIGREHGGKRLLGQRPYSSRPEDAHLIVLLAHGGGQGNWCTWLYDANKNAFFEGKCDMSYDEAISDFGARV